MRKNSIHQRITLFVAAAGLLLTVHTPVFAQSITVQASVDQTTVGVQDLVTFQVEIQGASFSDVDTPSAPETEGLSLIQPTPTTRRNVSIINGRIRQSIAFEWTFRPLREGDARIASMTVSIGGKDYRTEAIDLTVVAQSAQAGRRNAPSPWPFSTPSPRPDDDTVGDQPRFTDEDLFIRAIPGTGSVYQNGQIVVSYNLYFRTGIHLRQSRMADSWDAAGFWREELEVDPSPIPREVVSNGLRYNMIVLKKVAFFPTRTGKLVIDPLKIETEAYVPYRSSDPWGSFFAPLGQAQQIEVASEPVTIDVRPLPNNPPPGFSGAVGSFTLNTEIDRLDVNAGESVEMKVTISGTGNIATLEAPRLQAPGVFDVYDPKVSLNIDRNRDRVVGSKTFTYVLVPRANGTFELPPLEFSYFNPSGQRYITLRSDPYTFRVSGNGGAPGSARITASGLPVDDIASIMHGDVNWIPAGGIPLYRNPLTYVILALPLLALAGIWGYRRHLLRLSNDREYARSRRAHPVARKHLRHAVRLLKESNPRAFYEALDRAVVSFIGNRLNISETGLTRQQLDLCLIDAGVSEKVRQNLQDFLVECDRARFAPVLPDTQAQEQALYDAGHLITVLNEHLNNNQPVSARSK